MMEKWKKVGKNEWFNDNWYPWKDEWKGLSIFIDDYDVSDWAFYLQAEDSRIAEPYSSFDTKQDAIEAAKKWMEKNIVQDAEYRKRQKLKQMT